MGVHRVVVLGAYGTFGKRLCLSIVHIPHIALIVAGRSLNKAMRFRSELMQENTQASIDVAAIDVQSPALIELLRKTKADIVIHLCGPFQGQSYRVPEACLAINAHYIDLADDRRYVCGIRQFDQRAREQGLLLISGASSVPGLSSCVVDHFVGYFKVPQKLKYAITPGNRLERGYATIKAILSYTGQPFSVWKNGQWQTVFGWMDSNRLDIGAPIGKRRVANVDVPDLALFPARYPSLMTVEFKAGLELGMLHNAMCVMAWLVRKKVIKNWAPYAKLALAISRWFSRFGTDCGSMLVNITGLNHQHQQASLRWTLIAQDGMGPFIPTLSVILLCQKIVKGEISVTGAMPCLGLFSLDEFMALAHTWGIYADLRREGV